MNKFGKFAAACAALLCAFGAGLAHGGALKLDQYYGSGAVFQRGAAIPVAGRAAPGAEVKLTFDGRTASGKADAQGRWRIALPAHEAGGP